MSSISRENSYDSYDSEYSDDDISNLDIYFDTYRDSDFLDENIKKLGRDLIFDNKISVENIYYLIHYNIINLDFYLSNLLSDKYFYIFTPFIISLLLQNEYNIQNILNYFDIYEFRNDIYLVNLEHNYYVILDKNNIEHIIINNSGYKIPFGFVREIKNIYKPFNKKNLISSKIDKSILEKYSDNSKLTNTLIKWLELLDNKDYNNFLKFYNIEKIENESFTSTSKEIENIQNIFYRAKKLLDNICNDNNMYYLDCDEESDDPGYLSLIKTIIKYYTAHGYNYINNYIKYDIIKYSETIENNEFLEKNLLHSYVLVLNSFIYEFSNLFNTLIFNYETIFLYRGVKYEDKNSYKIGSNLRFYRNSFLSFSTNFNVANKFSSGVIYILKLDVNKHKYLPIIYELAGVVKDESEILLPLGTEFTISNISYSDTHIYIFLEINKQDYYFDILKYRNYNNNTNII